jgi:hypothetical protein
MDFDVAEIIGYSSTLSSTDGNTVTAYLAQKYGVAVAIPASFSNLTASQSIGAGTSSVFLSGTVSAPGPICPAAGEIVSITINGVTNTTTVSGTSGNFSITFPTASIPMSVTPYSIKYSYAGNATQLGAAPDNTSTALTVTEALSGYDAWANGTFSPALTAKLPGDNQDGDSLTNLQEFAFGTEPTVSYSGPIMYSGGVVTTTGAPTVVPAGGTYSMVFGRRADYVAAGLTYTVQFSAGLDTWVDNNDTTNPPVQVATDGTIDAMSVPYVDFITTPSGTQKPTFSRVKVVLTP